MPRCLPPKLSGLRSSFGSYFWKHFKNHTIHRGVSLCLHSRIVPGVLRIHGPISVANVGSHWCCGAAPWVWDQGAVERGCVALGEGFRAAAVEFVLLLLFQRRAKWWRWIFSLNCCLRSSLTRLYSHGVSEIFHFLSSVFICLKQILLGISKYFLRCWFISVVLVLAGWVGWYRMQPPAWFPPSESRWHKCRGQKQPLEMTWERRTGEEGVRSGNVQISCICGVEHENSLMLLARIHLEPSI